MNSTIELECFNCKQKFQKETKEYNRRIKDGADRFFCNISCGTFTRNKENPPPGNIANLARSTYDLYTPYRWYILRIKHRLVRHAKRKIKRNLGFNLTVEFLKNLWENQNGICPLSGCNMILPIDTQYGWATKTPYNASLDRIDNSKGYIESNVRFVSIMANLGRNTFTDKQLIHFCKAVAANNSK